MPTHDMFKRTYAEIIALEGGCLFQDRHMRPFRKVVPNEMYHLTKYEAVDMITGEVVHISTLDGPFHLIMAQEICW